MATLEERLLERQRQRARATSARSGVRTEEPGLRELVDRTLASAEANAPRAGEKLTGPQLDFFQRQTPQALDELEVQIRRAAGEQNPVGSSALRDFEQNLVGPRPGGVAPDRMRRFASGTGRFGEPVFDNDSIRKLNNAIAVQPETLRGGFGIAQPPNITPDEALENRVALGLTSQEEADSIRRRATGREANEAENLRTIAGVLTAQAEAANARAGARGAEPIRFFSTDPETGQQRVNNLSSEQLAKLADQSVDGVMATLVTSGVPGVQEAIANGTVTREGLKGQLAEFHKRFIDDVRRSGTTSGVQSEVVANDLFALGQALSFATNGKLASNLSPKEVFDTATSLLATQKSGIFGGSTATAGGVKVDLADLPGSVGQILSRLETAIIDRARVDPNSPFAREVLLADARNRFNEARARDIEAAKEARKAKQTASVENALRFIAPDFVERGLNKFNTRVLNREDDALHSLAGDLRDVIDLNLVSLIGNPIVDRLRAEDSEDTAAAREELRRLRGG